MHEIFKQNYVLTGNKSREQQSCNVTVNFKQRTDVRVARNHFDFVFQLCQRKTEYVIVWPLPYSLSPYILRVTPTPTYFFVLLQLSTQDATFKIVKNMRLVLARSEINLFHRKGKEKDTSYKLICKFEMKLFRCLKLCSVLKRIFF